LNDLFIVHINSMFSVFRPRILYLHHIPQLRCCEDIVELDQ
jgi:hypothetical protein